MSLTIAKFGGTSVASFAAMSRCANIVIANEECRVVVVSAPAGVTNHLVGLGNEPLSAEERQQVLDKVYAQINGIADDCQATAETRGKVQQLLTDMAEIAQHEELLHRPKLKDELLSFGERFSSLLFTQVLNHLGQNAVNFDVRNVMLTDQQYGQAVPDIAALKQKCQVQLQPLLAEHIVVTQGFIGATSAGATTTLGRGGSDYSAALLAEALDAQRCEIWTDVAGVYTTDPRMVEEAYPLKELSYDEAAEMANFGAKVLHPATLTPTLRNNIPVFVGSTLAPDQGGTLIVKDCSEEPPFRAITRRREQDLVTLHTPKAQRSAVFVGQVFDILDKYNLSIDLVTTSETAISLTFNDPVNTTLSQLNKDAITDLRAICDMDIEEGFDLVTLVGNHLQQTPGVLSQLFAQLQSFKIRLICYGANPHNISFLVDEGDSTAVIQALHKALFNPN